MKFCPLTARRLLDKVARKDRDSKIWNIRINCNFLRIRGETRIQSVCKDYGEGSLTLLTLEFSSSSANRGKPRKPRGFREASQSPDGEKAILLATSRDSWKRKEKKRRRKKHARFSGKRRGASVKLYLQCKYHVSLGARLPFVHGNLPRRARLGTRYSNEAFSMPRQTPPIHRFFVVALCYLCEADGWFSGSLLFQVKTKTRGTARFLMRSQWKGWVLVQ